jgi:hypothetical protein
MGKFLSHGRSKRVSKRNNLKKKEKGEGDRHQVDARGAFHVARPRQMGKRKH